MSSAIDEGFSWSLGEKRMLQARKSWGEHLLGRVRLLGEIQYVPQRHYDDPEKHVIVAFNYLWSYNGLTECLGLSKL